MKLNYKRTIFIGFAFFLICLFWQVYDSTIPLILTNKFGLSQTASGVIMALDNVLALFMLPLFGTISDRCKSRHGRRTPFIVVGTVLAAVLFLSLSFADNAQMKHISQVSSIDSPAALQVLYEEQGGAELRTPEGERFVLRELFDEAEFTSVTSQLQIVDGKVCTPDGESYALRGEFTEQQQVAVEKNS